MEKPVVLFAGFGAPYSSENSIRDFLTKLYGKEPSKEVVDELLKRYRRIGRSPFMDKLFQVCSEISKATGIFCTPIMKYTPPFFESIKEIKAEKFIIFPLSPFSSGNDFSEEIAKWISKNGGRAVSVENWGLDDSFIKFASEFIKNKNYGEFVFTAHSLPNRFQIYRENVLMSAERIAEEGGLKKFFVAFQSGREGWLSPSIDEVLKEVRSKEILIFPFGFFAECLETLYDLDILFKEKADSLGIKLKRLPALSEIDGFSDFLISKIMEEI